MKKLCLLILATAMLLGFASCDKKDAPTETAAAENSQTQAAADNKDTAKDAGAADAKDAADNKDTAKDAGAADAKDAAENKDPAVSEEDAIGKTTENGKIVIKYTGTGKGFGSKEVKAKSQYYVLDGFKEDGSLNAIKAKARVWYFFENAESYDAAVAQYGPAVKDKNSTSHFISVSVGMDNSWATYSDIVAEIERKGLSGTLVGDTNYELVR